jgi:hypothetical protein
VLRPYGYGDGPYDDALLLFFCPYDGVFSSPLELLFYALRALAYDGEHPFWQPCGDGVVVQAKGSSVFCFFFFYEPCYSPFFTRNWFVCDLRILKNTIICQLFFLIFYDFNSFS